MMAGEFGGEVVRAFKLFGKDRVRGDTLQAEEIATIPFRQRRALRDGGFVNYYDEPTVGVVADTGNSGTTAEDSAGEKVKEDDKELPITGMSYKDFLKTFKLGVVVSFVDEEDGKVTGTVSRRTKRLTALVDTDDGDQYEVDCIHLTVIE